MISCVGVLLAGSAAAATQASPLSEQWVTTWATAQPLYPDVVPPGMKPPPKPAKGSPIAEYPSALSAGTVRMIVRASAGGRQVRIELANSHGAAPVNIAASHIARSAAAASIVAQSDRVLTFGGRQEVTIPPGATVTSDAAELAVGPGEKLTVSLFLPGTAPTATVHALGLHTTYVIAGNATAAQNPHAESENRSYFWLSAVDVLAPGAATVAAFGDSITDGFGTTPDQDRAWPALLHTRLRAGPGTATTGVVNLGISGNRVLHDTAGASALARFDRDVLALEGIKWVVLLEGINDISYSAIPGFPASERVNEWIRSSGEFDALVDFDKVTRDPENPKRLRSAFDSGDHVHPNDAGNQAMANAFDLTIFQ
jgi:lysophospholipase L1-like esterase